MSVHAFVTAALLSFAAVATAQGGPGKPAKAGHAALTVGQKKVEFDKVSGSFMSSGGYVVVGLTYGPPNADHLAISLMVQRPSKVDLDQPFGNGIGYWKGGTIFQYEKRKSKCTLTVTKIIATEVEGTAECPVVNELNGAGVESLTGVKFSAKTG